MRFRVAFSGLLFRLQHYKAQRVLLNICPFVVVFSLSLGLLAYINIFPRSVLYFYAGSIYGILVRAIASATLFAYSLICVVSFKIKLNYHLIFIFVILMFFNFVMLFLTPHQFDSLYLSQYYGVGCYFVTSVSNKSVIVSCLSSIVDLFWGFCFLWILPYVFKRRAYVVIVITFFVVIMLITCFYSIVAEKDIFIYVFTDPSKIGSADGLKSLFDSKQTFGIFLCPAFCSCIVSISLLWKKSNRYKFVRYLALVFFVLSAIVLFFVSIVSLCRSAIVGNAISLLCFYLSLVIYCFKREKWIIGCFLTLVITGAIVFFVLFISVGSFHSSAILNNLYEFIMKHFFNRVGTSSNARLKVLVAFLREIPVSNLFFGFGKGLLDIYVRSVAPILIYGLHSGFAIFLGEYGLIMFFITYLLVFRVMWKNVKRVWRNPIVALSIFGCFITFLFLNISESEILIFSSSTPVFMFNYIVVVVANSSTVRDNYISRDSIYV